MLDRPAVALSSLLPLSLLALALALVSPSACAPAPHASVAAAPGPLAASTDSVGPAAAGPLRVTVTLAAALGASPVDGRLLVIFAKEAAPSEPVIGPVSDGDDSAQVFGVDVDGLRPGQARTIDASVLGYPIATLGALPAGDYVVQAVVHRYETFVRGDGHTVKLPPDRGEGQDWTRAPGNLVSAPRKVHVDARAGGELRIELTGALPALPDVADTKYVKHVRIQSERLTRFWGRPTFLGAVVVLPEGFDAHPRSHYPLAIVHGHFGREMMGWRETPPDPALPAPDMDALRKNCPNGHEGDACTKNGYPRLIQERSYDFFRRWTGKGFPRVLAVSIQHANPYYDDSYAVNSENLGPYGDAITYELVPYIEKTFRGLGPWARGMMGGSTGGWEALAAQVFYPDEYNGAVVNCPDPVDFHALMTVDVYDDANAYYTEGPFRRTARPGERDYLGRTRSTVEQQNLKELVLGTRSRSGGQWDVWQAVYSPVAADGYPKPIWDKRTGALDHEVAAFWREHYDLDHVMQRDWQTLGPKLRGKITINVGLSDNFFLNNAVYLVEDFFKSARPPADAVIDYGARDEHCWTGDHVNFNGVSRLTYLERFVPKLADHWRRTAPKGADVTSWTY
jgi:hypothetical protein